MNFPFGNVHHIVVEGPIGAGKTSLARRLAAHLGARELLELPAQNPFLPRFYQDRKHYALQTQLFFLFQRIEQQRNLGQRDLFAQPRIVADYMLEKDSLFARLTLSDEEFSLYHRIYEHVAPQAPTPDLVIYLQAVPETLSARVKKRGLDMEQNIDDAYLARISEHYSQFFYHYDKAPLMVVNSEHLNPAENDDDFQLLLERLAAMRGQRAYFNRAD